MNILSRKIYVTINNSWRDEPTEYVTTLEAPDKHNVCKSTSSINLRKYIEHGQVALCIKVEYAANIPSKRSSTRVEYIVGWDIFMPLINEENEFHPIQKMHFFCQQGPGFSEMKDLLWSHEDLGPDQLQVAGILSIDGHAPRDDEVNQMLG